MNVKELKEAHEINLNQIANNYRYVNKEHFIKAVLYCKYQHNLCLENPEYKEELKIVKKKAEVFVRMLCLGMPEISETERNSFIFLLLLILDIN